MPLGFTPFNPMRGNRNQGGGFNPGNPGGYGGGLPDFSQMFPGLNANAQADYLRPRPIDINVQRDPELQRLTKAWGDLRGQLATNTDIEATNAMSRGRDVTSGLASERELNAAQRGFGPDTGLGADYTARAYSEGLQSANALNANLAEGGRNKQIAALSGETGSGQAEAANLRQQEDFALSQARFQQDAQNAYAQFQALQNQNLFNNQLALLNYAKPFYSGY